VKEKNPGWLLQLEEERLRAVQSASCAQAVRSEATQKYLEGKKVGLSLLLPLRIPETPFLFQDVCEECAT